MTCGSTTCKPSNFPKHIEPVRRPTWPFRSVAVLNALLNRYQWRLWSLEIEKARQRRLLKHLDDRMLADIGLTREQAEKEAGKSFWL
jgi:uncharacterized protein YjiS (DUF1127 family)